MYIQLTKAKYQAGKLDEARALIQDSIFPAAREQKGFKGAYWAVDRAANVGIGVSLWESKEDVDALESTGFYREQVAKAAALLDGTPEREVYEVAAQA
ncbi:MAG: hypothetical protein Q8S13_11185 [Dehalococcoidia bacterium]|nr:hypothetical protein [Dehalococcoidia bacterium]